MDARPDHAAEEIKRLQRCINDLVSVLALPAIWTGGDTSLIVRTLLDVLLGMLRLDLIYVRVNDPAGEAALETARFAPSQKLAARPQEIGRMLDHWLGPDLQKWTSPARNSAGDGGITVAPLLLGLQGEIGVIVAGSQRADFPTQTERLVLSVAANQATIGLQEARLLSAQKRLANELEQRVEQRTRELAAANDELKREIAERKQAGEELRRSEAFLAEAQHLSSTGSFSWRVATDEVTWSEQLYRIYEFDRDAPATFEQIVTRAHPADIPSVYHMIERARCAGSDFEFEHRLLMPDRSVKHVHMVAHGSRDQHGRVEYVGAIQDVTERHLSEETLGKLRSELAHMARVMSLGALTASIAHEVNQPLSGIITNSNTSLRMLAACPPNVAGARETALRTIRDANRASDVIRRLRALFGKKDNTIELVDLNEAAREVIALSLTELQTNRVLLRSELVDDLPQVAGDRVQLQQVILNLVRNATDAMARVEDRPRYLVIRTERDEDDCVRLTVQDAGVGFDPQEANRLFDAFYSTKSDGMGIGLSVSRSIIESHHGRLWAARNDGPGATFAFSIPRQADRAAGSPVLGSDRTRAATTMGHILRNT